MQKNLLSYFLFLLNFAQSLTTFYLTNTTGLAMQWSSRAEKQKPRLNTVTVSLRSKTQFYPNLI